LTIDERAISAARTGRGDREVEQARPHPTNLLMLSIGGPVPGQDHRRRLEAPVPGVTRSSPAGSGSTSGGSEGADVIAAHSRQRVGLSAAAFRDASQVAGRGGSRIGRGSSA